MGQLKSCIQSLYEKIGCQNSAGQEMLGNNGVTESNMMQYLGVIEQRTNEILQMFRACQVGIAPGSPSHGDTSSSTISALLMPPVPAQPHGALKISIEPPEFEESQEGDDDYDDIGMDDEVDSLACYLSIFALFASGQAG